MAYNEIPDFRFALTQPIRLPTTHLHSLLDRAHLCHGAPRLAAGEIGPALCPRQADDLLSGPMGQHSKFVLGTGAESNGPRSRQRGDRRR